MHYLPVVIIELLITATLFEKVGWIVQYPGRLTCGAATGQVPHISTTSMGQTKTQWAEQLAGRRTAMSRMVRPSTHIISSIMGRMFDRMFAIDGLMWPCTARCT